MPLAGLGDQAVKVGQGAVLGVYILVIRDVIAEVDLRRGIAGSEPDGVNAQLLQVVQPRGNAVQVADAVAVRVLKAARVDLVDDGVLPPVALAGGGGSGWVPGGRYGSGLRARGSGKRCGPQKHGQGDAEGGFCLVHDDLLNAPPQPADWAASILGNARLYRNSGRSECRFRPGAAAGGLEGA